MTTWWVEDPVPDMVQASDPAQNAPPCSGQLRCSMVDVQFSVFSFTFPSKTKTTVLPSKDHDRTDESFYLVDAAFY